MKPVRALLLSSLIFFTSTWTPTQACTDFRLISKDGTVLITRSMEFALELQSNIRTSNRGRVFPATPLNGKPTMSWKATYGYVYLDGMNQDFANDGINEAGLSFEALYLPGETQYQTVAPGTEAMAIPYYHIGDWALSSFKNVDEIRTALQKMAVYSTPLPGANNLVFPLHFSFYDATGKGIVVEYVEGKLSIYDNDVGILTNSPTYPWHISNLRNYLSLSPYTPTPTMFNNLTFGATGQGAGALGLPGDVSPPSRFVKISFLNKVAYPASNTSSVLNLAQHIINNVDIMLGLTRTLKDGMESSELTQWVVFKDLTHGVFYYRTYGDMTLRQINLNNINFAEGSPRYKMPLNGQPAYILDETARLVKSLDRN